MHAVQPYLATLFLFLGVVDFFFLSNSFLLSVAHFLLCLQGLRLLSLKTARECLGSLLLSSLMILSASTLAVEWTFFVMLFLFLPAVIWTLILHNLVSENQKVQNEQVGKKTRLFSQKDHERMGPLHDKSQSWKNLLPSLRGASFLGFFVALFCCAMVFIFFPRINFNGFRGRFLEPVHRSGFSKEVDLKGQGRIFEDQSVVMRVEISPNQRKHWSGYLRGSVLEKFNGTKWERTGGNFKRIYSNWRGEIHVPINGRLTGKRLKQNIFLESMESPVMFAAPTPIHFKINRPFLVIGDDHTVQRPFGDSWKLQYEVESVVKPPFNKLGGDPYYGRMLEAKFTDGNPSYALQLEPSPIRDLAQRVTATKQNQLEQALTLTRYLSENYKYTLNLKDRNSENPLHEFLFVKKEGHCEYFASGLCLMLRSLGIRSRMVTGFLSHEWNERGHYVVVRMKHAHTWVEAKIEPFGWIELDPSPISIDPPARQSNFFKRIKEIQDYLNLRWNRYIMSYDWQKQLMIGRAIVSRSRKVSSRFDKWMGSFSGVFKFYGSILKKDQKAPELKDPTRFQFPWLLVVPVILFLIAIPLLIMLRGPKASRVWFYAPLLNYLEKKGGKKPSSATLKEFAKGHWAQIDAHKNEVHFLIQEYYRLRFKPNQSLSNDQAQSIQKALKTLG